MKKSFRLLLPIALVLLISLACTISLGAPAPTGPSQQDLMNTAVAQTLAAGNPPIPTLAPPPQATTAAPVQPPTLTPVVPPTQTPLPCNKALFISETIPDGTTFTINQTFTKTWRVKNTGTCTWNTNYKLVFSGGTSMNSPATKNLTGNVGPNEQVDLALSLKAQGSAGSYSGVWKLMADNGEIYTLSGFSTAINVTEPAAPAPKPDLIISEFSLTPAIPTMGQNVHVRVGAYNQGNAAAGAFVVRWYGLSTFSSPSCAWALPSMVAHGGQILECNFVFSSWYPINKTTIVYIDHDNQVAESNEGNNSGSITPFGVIAP